MTEVVMHITSGHGPEECRWVVGQLARAFAQEARDLGLDCALLETFEGNPSSVLLSVSGAAARDFAQDRVGSVLWTGDSPFRPGHKRRNWFAAVILAPSPDNMADMNEADVVYQAMRARGPGGQHVNKTDSAIRAIHRPSGLVATAQEHRSQHTNRKLALLKLAMMIASLRQASHDDERRDQWRRHQQLERGNPVRVYAGPMGEGVTAQRRSRAGNVQAVPTSA